jgi:2-polyprenyl-3-methyl-5-hydroxy-6-metoxy-1,4-benzoquinol methylase
LGHNAVGLDGSKEFVAMARSYSGCEVLHQDFLALALPQSRFDGVFANASLFHVPSQELPRVLLELSETLRPRGVLFCSTQEETMRKASAVAAIAASSISTPGAITSELPDSSR